METTYLTWLLLIPLILSLLAFAARAFGKASQFIIEGVHLISVTLVLVMSLLTVRAVLFTGPVFGLRDWLHVDALSAIFLLIIGVVGFLVGLYSIGYTRHDLESGELDANKFSTYYGLFSLFLFTMLLVVTANNIIMMWVAVEATTLGSAFLVGIYGHRSSLEAAWKYIIICTVGVAFGLYGTILVYSDAFNVMQIPGTAVLWTEIVKNTQALDPALIKMAFVFVLVGFGTKAGLFPMHAWLPDAHSEAPSPVSAMLSGVLLNCALLVVFRFGTISNLVVGPSFAGTLYLVFGIISVAAAAFFMYVQRDIKRLLAYSSMENIGLIVLAFGLGGPFGIFAGLLQAINHSLVKSLMFCTSGNILIKYHSRSLDKVQGMLQAIPVTGVLMIVGALALVGVPPLNIFVSKFLIVAAGLGAGQVWLMILCLLLLTVIFAAFFRVIASTLFGEKPEGVVRGEANWLTLFSGAALILLILALGLYIPPQLMTLLNDASGLALTGSPDGQMAISSMKDLLSSLTQLLP
ncbi:MAG: hydrogenase 4 subunit F [Chloroflexota bacterium]